MLPSKALLRRGDICRYYGLNDATFDDLVAAGTFRPVYLRTPEANKLPKWRQQRLPMKRRAHFWREEVVAAEQSGKIVAG